MLFNLVEKFLVSLIDITFEDIVDNNSVKLKLSEVLNERISDLNKQISQVEAKIAQSKIAVSRYEKQAIALRKEIEKIEQEKKDYNVTNNYKYKNDLSIELLDNKSS